MISAFKKTLACLKVIIPLTAEVAYLLVPFDPLDIVDVAFFDIDRKGYGFETYYSTVCCIRPFFECSSIDRNLAPKNALACFWLLSHKATYHMNVCKSVVCSHGHELFNGHFSKLLAFHIF